MCILCIQYCNMYLLKLIKSYYVARLESVCTSCCKTIIVWRHCEAVLIATVEREENILYDTVITMEWPESASVLVRKGRSLCTLATLLGVNDLKKSFVRGLGGMEIC